MRAHGRRHAALALLVAGCCLVAGAAVVLVLGALRHFDGYDWGDQTAVTADGRVDAVGVRAGRETLLWTYEADLTPRCEVEDRSGQVPVQSISGSYQRPGGSAGGWVAKASFEPRHDVVNVSCGDASTAQVQVMVEPKPHLPAAFAPFGDHAAWGVGVSVTGLLLVLATPLVLRRRRDEP